MIEISCHCGAISAAIEARPEFIHACNCSLCRKAGAWWGYYHPSAVRVTGVTQTYRRGDKPDPAVDVHFCGSCGSTTHFTLTDSAIARFGNVQLGVNMALAESTDLTGIELRYPDGRSWEGVGEFGYTAPARLL